MQGLIYQISMFFVEIPVNIGIHLNFWLWLLPIVAPFLIFFMKVERSVLSHLFKVLCAIGLTYLLLNLALHTERSLNWHNYIECQHNSTHSYMSLEMSKECSHHVNIADGAQNVLFPVLAWIPAAFYAGFWETLWRIRYRKKIRAIGKDFKGKWFSNMTICLMLTPFLIFAIPLLYIK